MLKLNILITGGSGLIGSHLLGFLRQKNFQLMTLGKKKENTFQVDLTKKKEVKKFFNYNKFDYILHCAGHVPQFKKKNSNKDWIKNHNMLVNIVNYTKAKIIFFSSTKVYDSFSRIGYEFPIFKKNITSYQTSKICSENYILKNRQNSTIIRLPSVFGKKVESGLIYKVTKSLIKTKRFNLKKIPNHNWSILHIDRLNFIVLKILRSKEYKGIINVGYNCDLSTKLILKKIISYFKVDHEMKDTKKFSLDFKRRTFFSLKQFNEDIQKYINSLENK